jgi:cell division protein FtsQ
MTEDKINKKKRKPKIILIFSFIVFIMIAVVVFAIKSDYFIIKSVTVEKNLFVTKEEIILLADVKDKNIFMIDKNNIEQKVKVNPYIEKIFIKRSLPDSVTIEVTEKKIKGVVKYQNGFVNIDSEGRMVQIVTKFPNGKLPIIRGITIKQYLPGECLYKNDKNKLTALKAVLTIMDYKESRYFFKTVNVTDPFNITLQSNNGFTLKIGDWTNIDYKIAYAITIIKNSSVKGLKGYIQLQDDGSAIFKKN